ncbi:MAG: sigma-54 dependent transcriptional regulator [Planctomycetota bacterium]
MTDLCDSSDRLEPLHPPRPVILGMGSESAAAALEHEGLVLEPVADWATCATRLHAHDVRALVLAGDDPQRLARDVQRARQEAPLVDVLVWAPGAGGELVRLALQRGAADVVLATHPERLAAAVSRIVDRQTFLPLLRRFESAREGRGRFEGLLSKSDAMWKVFETVVQIAPSGAAVLLLGETGVGKELLARAVHRYSGRAGRFVAVNCGAIPENLVDSELFGHEAGTFTGAVKSKPGLFRSAEGGTLFLDEVGHLPLSSQYSFLRALQEEAVRPVGGAQEIPVDARVVAATSRALDEEARQGRFRDDLLFRLDVIRLEIPPLRARPEDILHLFGHFRRKLAKHYRLRPPEPSEDFLEALLAYPWPGNVRELENVTERLVLTHHGKRINRRQFEALKRPRAERPAPRPSERLRASEAVDVSRSLAEFLEPKVEEHERRYLDAVLRSTAGRIGDSAKVAGISPRTLLRKMKQHGLDKRAYRAP